MYVLYVYIYIYICIYICSSLFVVFYFYLFAVPNPRPNVFVSLKFVNRDSSVGIATRYRLNRPGIESRWGRDFPHLSSPALGPTQPPVPDLSAGDKAAVAWL